MEKTLQKIHTDIYLLESELQGVTLQMTHTANCLQNFHNVGLGEKSLKMSEDPTNKNSKSFTVWDNESKALELVKSWNLNNTVLLASALIDLHHKISGCKKYIIEINDDLRTMPTDCYKDEEIKSFIISESDRILNQIIIPAERLMEAISLRLRTDIAPKIQAVINNPKAQTALSKVVDKARPELKGKTFKEVLQEILNFEGIFGKAHLSKALQAYEKIESLADKLDSLPIAANPNFLDLSVSYFSALANNIGFSLTCE